MDKKQIKRGVLQYFKMPTKSLDKKVWLWDRINHAWVVGGVLLVGLWQNPGALLFILLLLSGWLIYIMERK